LERSLVFILASLLTAVSAFAAGCKRYSCVAPSMSSAESIRCVDELPAVVTLDEGINKDGASTPDYPVLRMQCLGNDREFLKYSVFQDAANTKAWGTRVSKLAFSSRSIGKSRYDGVREASILQNLSSRI
jgi:spore coat protein U-like protein